MRGSSVLLVYLVLLVGVVFLFRNQRRKQRAAQDVRSNVTPGSDVMTTAGLYGTVVEVLDDASIVIEAAPGVRLRFDKRAIARVIDAPEPEAGSTPDEDEPTHSTDHTDPTDPDAGAHPDEPER